MNIIISGSHFEDFPNAKKYAQEKLERLTKYHPRIEKIAVRLISEKAHRNEKHDFTCEIIASIPGNNLEITEYDLAPDKAFDIALDRMKRLLIKSKEKQTSKKHKQALEEQS